MGFTKARRATRIFRLSKSDAPLVQILPFQSQKGGWNSWKGVEIADFQKFAPKERVGIFSCLILTGREEVGIPRAFA
jgi:hypothetical protein